MFSKSIEQPRGKQRFRPPETSQNEPRCIKDGLRTSLGPLLVALGPLLVALGPVLAGLGPLLAALGPLLGAQKLSKKRSKIDLRKKHQKNRSWIPFLAHPRLPRAPFSRNTRLSTCENGSLLGVNVRRSQGIRTCVKQKRAPRSSQSKSDELPVFLGGCSVTPRRGGRGSRKY